MSIKFTVPGLPVEAEGPPTRDLDRAISLVLAAGARDERVFAFRVEGQPIAKQRVRIRNNRRQFYTPSKTRDAEEEIAWTIKRARRDKFLGNVAVGAIFYRSNRHRIDLDNMLKTVLDGVTKSRIVWNDDDQVSALAGVVEYDADWPRIAVAIAPHDSSLGRGEDKLSHVCETCKKRYYPHGGKGGSRYCSRACRPRRIQICQDCGGPTSAPHVKRCRPCHVASRQKITKAKGEEVDG